MDAPGARGRVRPAGFGAALGIIVLAGAATIAIGWLADLPVLVRSHSGAATVAFIVAELGTATLAAMVLANAWMGPRAARRMTEPLRAMAATAQRIADGDLVTPVPTGALTATVYINAHASP